MRAYILADLRRVARRVPRVVVLALAAAILMIVLAAILSGSGTNASNAMVIAVALLSYVGSTPAFVGLLEMAFVYGDDLRAGTMKTAIGGGMSRNRIVLVKFFEMLLLTLADYILLGLAVFIPFLIWGCGTAGALAGGLAIGILCAWVQLLAYMSLCMFMLYLLPNTLFGFLGYLALCTGIAGSLLGMVLGVGSVGKLGLERFTLSTQCDLLTAHLILGRLNLGALAGVLIYAGLGFALTFFLFRKKELDF